MNTKVMSIFYTADKIYMSSNFLDNYSETN